MQKTNALHLLGEQLPSRVMSKIFVSAKHLITTLTREQYLKALLFGIPGDEIVGNSASHQGRIKGLQIVNDLWQCLEYLFEAHNEFVVFGVNVAGNEASAADIFALPHPYGKGFQSGTQSEFQRYSRRTNSRGEVVSEEPVDRDNDALDALRNGFVYLYGLVEKSIQYGVVKPGRRRGTSRG